MNKLHSKFMTFSGVNYFMSWLIILDCLIYSIILTLYYSPLYLPFLIYTGAVILFYLIFINAVNKKHRWKMCIIYAVELCARTVFISLYLKIDSYFEILLLSLLTFVFVCSKSFIRHKAVFIFALTLYALTYIFEFCLRLTLFSQISQISPQQKFFAHTYTLSIFVLSAGQLIYLSCFAAHILNHIYNRNLHTQRELEYVAGHDILTSLMNRYRASTVLAQCQQRKESERLEYAIAILDIDDFKKINDVYGHDCGDFILKSYTSELRKKLPVNIKIARWGGEEFIIIFPVASAETPFELDKIRESLAMQTFTYKNTPVHVTATYGISSSRKFKTPYQVLNDADNHLLIGKDNGKNRLVVSQNF